MKVWAIIPAAGKGRRMGGGKKKPFLPLHGIPILALTLNGLMRSTHIEHFLVCIQPEDTESLEKEIFPHLSQGKEIEWVEGGARRQDSVYNALRKVDTDVDLVLIHDGVRPFITSESIEKAISETVRWGATVFGLPVQETLKAVDEEGFVLQTLDRQRLWHIQTPQTFRRDLIINAYQKAQREGLDAPDDASLVERCGQCIKVLSGFPENIKITTPQDLSLGEKIWSSPGQSWSR